MNVADSGVRLYSWLESRLIETRNRLSVESRDFLNINPDPHRWAQLKLSDPRMVAGVEIFTRVKELKINKCQILKKIQKKGNAQTFEIFPARFK